MSKKAVIEMIKRELSGAKDKSAYYTGYVDGLSLALKAVEKLSDIDDEQARDLGKAMQEGFNKGLPNYRGD